MGSEMCIRDSFSDVLRALEKEKLLKLETDEGGNMLVHIL